MVSPTGEALTVFSIPLATGNTLTVVVAPVVAMCAIGVVPGVPRATGALIVLAARCFFPARQRGMNHGRGAPNSTLHRNRTGWAVELAGATFHACFWPDQFGSSVVRSKHSMRTDQATHAAVVAKL